MVYSSIGEPGNKERPLHALYHSINYCSQAHREGIYAFNVHVFFLQREGSDAIL